MSLERPIRLKGPRMLDRQGLHNLPSNAFLRLPDVLTLCGLGRATVYRRIALGRFPAPEKITERASAWRVGAILCWLESPMDWRRSASASA
jgi:prophage regulatory protein